MKYTALFGLAALALGFTACDDIEDATGLPQTNPQLGIVNAENVSVSAGSSASSVIDLEALNNAGSTITIAKVSEATDWPEGFTAVVPTMEIGKDDSFTKTEAIEVTMGAEGDVIVAPDALEEAYVNLIGKNPNAKTVYARFVVYAVNGSQKVRMGGENYFYGNFPVEVKPFDLFNGQIIEDAYYLINSADNWDITKAIPFGHAEADPYDDPVFSVVVDVNGGGYQWAVIPATTYAAGVLGQAYGVEDSAEAAGNLVEVPAGGQITYGLFNEAGPHMITINMLSLTYDGKLAIPQLYTPGDTNGWNQAASQVLTTTNYTDYTGYAHLSGGFKFSTQPNWDGTNYGAAGEGVLSTDGGAANLAAPKDALYWCQANIVALTYSLTEIETIGLIGDATPAGWDASTALQPSADFLVWSATVEMKDGEFKFRANDGWDINLGGSLDNLTQGGDNMASPGAGTYVVTLDLSSVPYTAKFTKQ